MNISRLVKFAGKYGGYRLARFLTSRKTEGTDVSSVF